MMIASCCWCSGKFFLEASELMLLFSTCSELPSSVSLPLDSNVNAHKRQGSPSTIVLEDKSTKKRHFTEDEMTVSTEEYTNQMQSDNVMKSGEAITHYSREVEFVKTITISIPM